MTNLSPNIRPNLAGDTPEIHPSALIDPSAQIIGNVIVKKNAFIGPLAIIRADERGPDGVSRVHASVPKLVPRFRETQVDLPDKP